MKKLSRLLSHGHGHAPLETVATGAPPMVYLFREGNMSQKMLLGGKGANLCEMARLGLPVPPGFVVTTACCKAFEQNDGHLPDGLKEAYLTALKSIEAATGKTFGDPNNPLLVSVRSGAPASMPGMMDTVLNLGMNDEVAEKLAERTGNARFVHDTHRRFLQMYSDVVMGLPKEKFEEVMTEMKEARGVKKDVELTAEDLAEVVQRFKAINPDVPSDPQEQLERAIKAVFHSWHNPRAVHYRAYNSIPNDWGTAVTVQAMVFGNANADSGTGVAFSRNPSNGDPQFFGEFLENAEGEDVVAGVRTPKRLEELRAMWPAIYEELDGYQKLLERHYRDMQDLEFTIEDGKLYMLQCRVGKRTAKAAARIAVDLVNEGLITEQEALLRINPAQTDYFLHPTIDPAASRAIIGKGLPASPGAATGEIVFCPDDAERLAKQGKTVILCRRETTPEDIHGMKAAQGILTQLGGMTSHAAVVARAMGKCCVSGAGDVHVDVEHGEMRCADGKILKAGHVITLDGLTGEVLEGDVARVAPGEDEHFQTVLKWADKWRRLKVMTNADTPEEAKDAARWGAQGIGLCRTEHMFFSPERIDVMRAMILAESKKDRMVHLDRLFAFQRDDMLKLFAAMDGLPVTIRTLDPPLHEFLPVDRAAIDRMPAITGRTADSVTQRLEELAESNPMLGFRGCRLTVVYPEITEMQVRAIMTAAATAKQLGFDPKPEIMIPVVSSSRELDLVLSLVRHTAISTLESEGADVPYKLGTMIELPRACICADKLAATGVQFMSFGTNDLTQTTWGFSRDDMSAFVPSYVEQGVLPVDPFVSIDEDGVGELITMAVERARSVSPDITVGICGEHGGEPRSVEFFHRQGFEYVSCSPFRVPIARIAAGQAAAREQLKQQGGGDGNVAALPPVPAAAKNGKAGKAAKPFASFRHAAAAAVSN